MGSFLAYLEPCSKDGTVSQRIPIEPVPFRLGRNPASHWVIPLREVSHDHAEIVCEHETFVIRDLKSTNGTFVNGKRIQIAILESGVIIHLARQEFRFVLSIEATDTPDENPPTLALTCSVPASLIRTRSLLHDLLTLRHVRALFHPIMDLATYQTMGYEALGRGTQVGLSILPVELFGAASQCGVASELSQIFRLVALKDAHNIAAHTRVFCNIHESELTDRHFLDALPEFVQALPRRHQLVLEVHENAVADLVAMRELRDRLSALGIELAYDDFGAGQARFMELAEVPPDFLKLDMRLVRDLPTSPSRQQLVRALTQVAQDLSVHVIAEGIQTKDEATVCLDLGCEFGQGYLFGRPQSSATLVLGETYAPSLELDMSSAITESRDFGRGLDA